MPGSSSDRPDPSPEAPTSQRGESVAGGGLTYRDAGVDIDAGNEAVRRIRALVGTTHRPEQVGDIGGFAGMMRLPAGVRDPVLVSCADGVGTKILVAIAMGRHDTIGIDLVAMNVNDLLVTGARPLFVLDYIACARVEPAVIEAIVAGVAEGCRQSGAALLGGETAEMPDLYAPGHYDLAAFAVGVAEGDALLGPHRVTEGDVVLGLPASGLHSNGYSLARKALLDPSHAGLALSDPLPGGTGESVGDALLVPTRIYASAFAALQRSEGTALHAAAHITGGGLLENPPRALPEGLAAELDLRDVPRPPVLRAIADQGVEAQELHRTFNCGIGMLLFVDAARADAVVDTLGRADEPCLRVGTVVRRAPGTAAVRIIDA
jgi:phosphoribosylformylglycinamidine cyclo-ligase